MKGKRTGTDDLDFNGLLGSVVVEATLVSLGSLDGGGEQGVDERRLSESRLTYRLKGSLRFV